MAMLRALPQPEMMRFGIGVRSHFIDELLLEALASEKIATVLSLGSGLDTRPWRLDLPAELRWIEVDFAEMLDYKNARMSPEAPRCRREFMTADVNDAAQRTTIYAAVGAGPALMITEGLLMYLPAATVEALAAEVWRERGIAHWMSEITTTTFLKTIGMMMPQSVREVQALDCLNGEQILETIRRQGWRTAARRSYFTDMAFAMERAVRMFGDRPKSEGPPPITPDEPTGIHRFTR
jgi:methyltransferase (TIGR00027 family)